MNTVRSPTTPTFGTLAEATGIKGYRVSDLGQFESVLREALAYPGPVVIDAVVRRQELSIPLTTGAKQAAGPGLYAFKVLMDGHGGELLEVAKTNLFWQGRGLRVFNPSCGVALG